MNPEISIIIPVYNVEKYIEQMLDSVKHQTFKNYEVIIVNDGSPDNSQSIIDRFCESDDRFKSFIKENGGVASARNFGISKASGRFVVFYDPDDYIPKDALEKMYKSIIKDDSDIAVGAMSIVRAGEYRVNGNTLKLSKKDNISKTDADMLWSFSVCNKMFKMDLIKSNNIKFEAFKHAEDALFLFECIFKARKITGCSLVVYQYMIRPFWEEKSATQIITTKYLLDVINALDSIEKIIEQARCEEFTKAFFVRYCEISLISGYYRQFWALDDSALVALKEKITSLREKMGEITWNSIFDRNLDLQLDKNIFSKKDMISNALLTIVISKDCVYGIEDLNQFLMSIYDQGMPSFIIKADRSIESMIADEYKSKPNLYFYDSLLENDLDTEYVMYADTRILQSKNSIKMMMNALIKDRTLDYVTAPIKSYKNGRLNYSVQMMAFTTHQLLRESCRYKKVDFLDYMTGNKIFRVSSVLSLDPKLFFEKNLNFKKLINASMIVRCDDSFIKDECPHSIDRFYIYIKMLQKNAEDRIIDFIKQHFTKEDVKKLLKKDI